jgi:hypothetical protein
MRTRQWLLAAGLVVLVDLATTPVRADAVDVWDVLTRVGNWHESPALACAPLAGMLALNYALNLLVLGVPVMVDGVRFKRSAVDLIGFTAAAQIADRFGALLVSRWDCSFPACWALRGSRVSLTGSWWAWCSTLRFVEPPSGSSPITT